MLLYPKTRGEWLALRNGFVSSTESAALFGLSPYMTPYELAVLKKNPESGTDLSESERMTWGKRLQRAIAQGIAEDEGVKVRALSAYATLPEDKIGASFDYEIIGLRDDWKAEDTHLRGYYRQHGAGVLEIKNVDSYIFKQEWHESDGQLEAPAHIELQVQHQLLCIERAWSAIGVLVGGNRQIMLVRMRDDETGTAIRAKVGRFWSGLAQGKMPPVTLPQDAATIRRLYGYAEPGKILDFQTEPNEAIYRLAKQHEEAVKFKREADNVAKGTAANLLMAIQDAEKVLFSDMTVNAGVVKAAHIEAYERAAYRNLRIYPKGAK